MREGGVFRRFFPIDGAANKIFVVKEPFLLDFFRENVAAENDCGAQLILRIGIETWVFFYVGLAVTTATIPTLTVYNQG